MPKYRVAVVGGGIAGLCLAASLTQLNRTVESDSEVYVDVYEASPEFIEIGAGITLWGRVCEALRQMGMKEDCVRASVLVASKSGEDTTDGFVLRGFRDDADYGRLPFEDAWSLARADLLNILARRVPRANVHLGKRLVEYYDPPSSTAPIRLAFSDGTNATCDVLVGADGIRSVVRAKLMRDASSNSNTNPELNIGTHSASSSHHSASLTRYINPRFSGTLAYRALLPLESLRVRNPRHRMLKGGVVYFGKSQHIVGYPISSTTLNLAINVTNLAHVDAEWPPRPSHRMSSSSSAAQFQHHPRPSQSSYSPTTATSVRERAIGSRTLDRVSFQREIASKFAGWGSEVEDIIQCVGTCTEWPVMDLDPLPFYTRGRVVLMGDAAHAAVPYVGAGAAFAIEDAYILSNLLHAAAQPNTHSHHSQRHFELISRALHTYEVLRLPRGNSLVQNARLALRSFQFDGPCGNDMRASAGVVCRVFEGAAGVGEGGAKGTSQGYGSTSSDDRRGPVEEMRWGVAKVRGMV